MVFFNCNACGEALKKNQVEKHTFRCRSCEVLSCVDCGKNFWGDDYQSHTKCMTEEQKYCGPGYVSKVNKGEVKQEQWIEKVQTAIDKSSTNPGLKRLLIRLKDYPNIPRKQQKFQNFLKNSLRIWDANLCTQVWDALMAHSAQAESKTENKENGTAKEVVKPDVVNENGNDASDVDKDEPACEVSDSKKSKREKKEERRNKANKKEKKDKSEPAENGEEHIKKSKKRKHKDEDADEEALSENVTAEERPLKKKKKKHASEEDVEEAEENEGSACDDNQPKEDKPKKKTKFEWEKTITSVLENKGEMSLKKLRKKVLGEFAALDAANYSEENLLAKFDKKVRKLTNVQVLKDRAKLKEK